MKKIFSVLFCLLLIFSVMVVPVSAKSNVIFVKSEIEYLDDGSYWVEEIYQNVSYAKSSGTTTGYKTSYYKLSNGTTVFSVTVTGSFTYNGSTSSATSSSASVTGYVSGVTYLGKRAYTSGNTAYATGSVRYNGSTLSRTVQLSCDKNGNLS